MEEIAKAMDEANAKGVGQTIMDGIDQAIPTQFPSEEDDARVAQVA